MKGTKQGPRPAAYADPAATAGNALAHAQQAMSGLVECSARRSTVLLVSRLVGMSCHLLGLVLPMEYACQVVLQNFLDFLSHQIFRRMHLSIKYRRK